MDTFLQAIGAVTLAVVALIVFAGFLLWMKWRRFKKVLMNAFEGSDIGRTPSELTLRRCEDDLPPEAGRDCAALLREGFARAGRYAVTQMPGLLVEGFVKEDEGLMGAVYGHPQIGVWADICVTFTNGEELTAGSAKAGAEMDTRPGVEKLFLAQAPAEELLREVRSRIRGRVPAPVTVLSFAREFEESYRKDMAWRNSRGGVSKEEVLRVAANMGRGFEADVIEATYLESKKEELGRWHEEAMGRFLQTTTMGAAEWKRREDGMFLADDAFEAEAWAAYVGSRLEEAAGEEVCRAVLQRLRAGEPVTQALQGVCREQGVPLEFLARIDFPVAAWVCSVAK